jgi:hypothetical protein
MGHVAEQRARIGDNLVASLALDVTVGLSIFATLPGVLEQLTQRNPHRKHPSPTRGHRDPASWEARLPKTCSPVHLGTRKPCKVPLRCRSRQAVWYPRRMKLDPLYRRTAEVKGSNGGGYRKADRVWWRRLGYQERS